MGMNELDSETLRLALDYGMIDMERLKEDVDMLKKKEYLEKYPYKVWQGSNGKWYTHLPDEKSPDGRKLVKRATREKIEQAIVDHYKAIDRIPTFKECYFEWQDYSLKCGKISKSSYDRRDCDYHRFIENYALFDRPIDKILESDLISFLDTVLSDFKGQLPRRGFNNLKSLINGTFVYAKVIKRKPCIFTKELMSSYSPSPRQLRKKAVTLQVFDDEEVDMIINHIVDEHWSDIRYLGILFMLFTGLRVGECSTLKMDDFIASNKVFIQRTLSKEKDEYGKSRRVILDYAKTESSENAVLLSDDALKVINQVFNVRDESTRSSEWVFGENGSYIPDTKFDKQIRKLCSDLGIPARGCHKLRKTYCSKLLDIGVGEKIVQNQMRHSDIQTTKNHYYFSTKREAAILAVLNCNNKLA